MLTADAIGIGVIDGAGMWDELIAGDFAGAGTRETRLRTPPCKRFRRVDEFASPRPFCCRAQFLDGQSRATTSTAATHFNGPVPPAGFSRAASPDHHGRRVVFPDVIVGITDASLTQALDPRARSCGWTAASIIATHRAGTTG